MKNQGKIFWLTLVICAVLVLTACGQKTRTNGGEETSQPISFSVNFADGACVLSIRNDTDERFSNAVFTVSFEAQTDGAWREVRSAWRGDEMGWLIPPHDTFPYYLNDFLIAIPDGAQRCRAVLRRDETYIFAEFSPDAVPPAMRVSP